MVERACSVFFSPKQRILTQVLLECWAKTQGWRRHMLVCRNSDISLQVKSKYSEFQPEKMTHFASDPMVLIGLCPSKEKYGYIAITENKNEIGVNTIFSHRKQKQKTKCYWVNGWSSGSHLEGQGQQVKTVCTKSQSFEDPFFNGEKVKIKVWDGLLQWLTRSCAISKDAKCVSENSLRF